MIKTYVIQPSKTGNEIKHTLVLFPVNKTRVKIVGADDEPGSDYINANYVAVSRTSWNYLYMFLIFNFPLFSTSLQYFIFILAFVAKLGKMNFWNIIYFFIITPPPQTKQTKNEPRKYLHKIDKIFLGYLYSMSF